MRNPNGYGTVVKLSGNRRKPYAVRKTVGWKDNGQPILKAIGYTATRKEGMIMLAEYNRSPYDLDKAKITANELFKQWQRDNPKRLAANTMAQIVSLWKHCKKLYDVPYADLRRHHIQSCVDHCGKSYSTQQAIKSIFSHLDKYALELEIIRTSHSALVVTESTPETKRIVFTDAEIECLWANLEAHELTDSVLILLYSGWRISELLGLTKADIDLRERTMKGGVKTKSGKNRIVPIHDRILPLIKGRYEKTDNKLFNLSDDYYRTQWKRMMTLFGMEHTPHECRHTFRSRLDSAGANKVCIDMLMGHKSESVGERVYTHKTIEELRQTIALLP